MDEDRIKEYFNEVDCLTAICRSTHSWTSGEHPELEIGREYRLTHIGVLRSATSIMLSDFPGKEYNSTCFDILENGNKVNYTDDCRFLAPYLKKQVRPTLASMRMLSKRVPSFKDEIEKQFGVKLLYMTLSGSRCYGYATAESDWDIRFIYEKTLGSVADDTIYRVFDFEVDAFGWEINYAKQLIEQCEPEIFRCVTEPILGQKEGIGDELKELMDRSFDPNIVIRNLFSIAKTNYGYCNSKYVPGVLLIQSLRSILYMRWIDLEGKFPDGIIRSMIQRVIDDEQLRHKIWETFTRSETEGDFILDDDVKSYIETWLSYYNNSLS